MSLNSPNSPAEPARLARSAAVVSLITLMLVAIAPGAFAQSGAPEGADCFRIDSETPVDEFRMPGDHDLAILVLEDGTEVSIGSVTDGQVVPAPGDSRIVAAYKCDFPEGDAGGAVTPTPEPTVEATPEPTPVPEETPTVAEEPTPTSEPTEAPTPTPEPTEVATPEPEPTETVLAPPVTPTPEPEVLPAVQESDEDEPSELAVTGTNTTALLVIIGVTLLAGGGLLRVRRSGFID